MTGHDASPRASVLGTRGWSLVARGAAAILAGILVVAVPPTSLFAVVVLWGSYALVDAITVNVLAKWADLAGLRYGWLAFEALVSLGTGVLTFLWHDLSAVGLLTVIASWAVLTGFSEVVGAIRLRRLMTGERALAASGIVAFSVGVFLLVVVGPRALANPWLIDAYALLFGALLIALGVGGDRWKRAEARSRS
jgi:uncharacterized membrane protein HdeD (DUF308 family)